MHVVQLKRQTHAVQIAENVNVGFDRKLFTVWLAKKVILFSLLSLNITLLFVLLSRLLSKTNLQTNH